MAARLEFSQDKALWNLAPYLLNFGVTVRDTLPSRVEQEMPRNGIHQDSCGDEKRAESLQDNLLAKTGQLSRLN